MVLLNANVLSAIRQSDLRLLYMNIDCFTDRLDGEEDKAAIEYIKRYIHAIENEIERRQKKKIDKIR